MSATPQSRPFRYLIVALRWLSIAAVTFAVSFAIGRYITDHFLPQVYTARATIQVPAGDLVVPAAGSTPEPVAFQPEFENIIRSPDFLLSLIKDLGLDKIWAKRVYRLDQDEVPDVDALTNMEKVLTFKVTTETSTIDIIAASDVPQEAADIANGVADRYQAWRVAGKDIVLQKGRVTIVSHAEVPTIPTHPNKSFAFFVIALTASILGIIAASFVEIILLFLRAGERVDN